MKNRAERICHLVGILFLTEMICCLSPASADGLPRHFIYLRDIDPTILQEMRYYGSHNFLGRRVKGYQAAECILTVQAASALKKVQIRLRAKNLSLKVYDCYRPRKGVADFIAWSQDRSDQKTKKEFYPTLAKSNLFAKKYIARRSAHSRGSTVDLTIVPLPPAPQPRFELGKTDLVPCHFGQDHRFPDNSLDFGTGFDCFHELSHTWNPAIKGNAKENRRLLVTEMERVGFKNYFREWWHFTLKNEPYRKTYFDFPIKPRTARKEAAARPKAGASSQVITTHVSPVPKPVVALQKTNLLKVVCVADDDTLNVRTGIGTRYPVIDELPPDAVNVIGLDCNGKITLSDWHALDAVGKRTTRPPWCRIELPWLVKNGQPTRGWVSGAYVAKMDARDIRCQ